MKVLLLATGETQKLRPLTEHIPSPMVPVMNRPIMAYNLELLGRLGFKHILVSVHWKADRIEKYFGDGKKWGLTLQYLLQRDPLGSAGAIQWARSLLQEPFLVMPADQVADFELKEAIQQHTESRSMATIVVQVGMPRPNRSLHINDAGEVYSLSGRHSSPFSWIDTGTYLFDPGIVDIISPRLSLEIHQHLLPKLLACDIPIRTVPIYGYWNPLETFEQYAEAQRVFLGKAKEARSPLDDKATYLYTSQQSRPLAPGVWTGRNTKIHPSVKISPPVHIGSNSWVRPNAEIGPGAVIGSNVIVDEGASIHNSTVIDHTYVGKLVCLEDRLASQDQLINLKNHDSIRITDPVLLNKLDPHYAASGLVRVMEIVGVSLLLLIKLPFILIVAAVLKLTTGQVIQRVPCQSSRYLTGKDRRITQKETFHLLHFNTRTEDGRLVPLGRWLESWEGHRMLELINVLKGDLGIIGLKPVLTEEESRIRASWMLEPDKVQPGLTGLWYVQTGGESRLEEDLVADAYYLATRSWPQDWKILWRTPFAWYQKNRRASRGK